MAIAAGKHFALAPIFRNEMTHGNLVIASTNHAFAEVPVPRFLSYFIGNNI
jgi:hypothetical protein